MYCIKSYISSKFTSSQTSLISSTTISTIRPRKLFRTSIPRTSSSARKHYFAVYYSVLDIHQTNCTTNRRATAIDAIYNLAAFMWQGVNTVLQFRILIHLQFTHPLHCVASASTISVIVNSRYFAFCELIVPRRLQLY